MAPWWRLRDHHGSPQNVTGGFMDLHGEMKRPRSENPVVKSMGIFDGDISDKNLWWCNGKWQKLGFNLQEVHIDMECNNRSKGTLFNMIYTRWRFHLYLMNWRHGMRAELERCVDETSNFISLNCNPQRWESSVPPAKWDITLTCFSCYKWLVPFS